MKRLLMVFSLGMIFVQLCSAAPPDLQNERRRDIQNLETQILTLQEQMMAASAACRGDGIVSQLQGRINELYERLSTERRNSRGSLDQGGEACASAVPILAIPFCDTGNTNFSTDDFSPPAACGPSSAPDVVYSYDATVTRTASVSLCGSNFDTMLEIWRGCPGTPGSALVACNNDGQDCPPASCIPTVDFVAGNTYYIVVDGAGTSHGDYRIAIGGGGVCPVDPCPGCPFACPPGALTEPEPCPSSNPDVVNGGCSAWPVLFTNMNCGDTYCGTAVANASVHDHDAYAITLTQRDSLRWCIYSQFDVTINVYQYFSGG